MSPHDRIRFHRTAVFRELCAGLSIIAFCTVGLWWLAAVAP